MFNNAGGGGFIPPRPGIFFFPEVARAEPEGRGRDGARANAVPCAQVILPAMRMPARCWLVGPRSSGRCISDSTANTTVAVHGIAPRPAQIDCSGREFADGSSRGNRVWALEQQGESAGDDRCREGRATHRRIAARQAGGFDVRTRCREGDKAAAAGLDEDLTRQEGTKDGSEKTPSPLSLTIRL